MWLKEIQQTLTADGDSGLYKLASGSEQTVRFMLTTEVCTIFDFENQNRKVHHVILSPSIEVATQINDALWQVWEFEFRWQTHPEHGPRHN